MLYISSVNIFIIMLVLKLNYCYFTNSFTIAVIRKLQFSNNCVIFIFSPMLIYLSYDMFVRFSCFLLTMKDDSIEGIYDTLKQCAQISKTAGGIGLSIHCIRASGSYISGTNGTSNGVVPMLRVFNNTARYVDQGGNKVCLTSTVWLDSI